MPAAAQQGAAPAADVRQQVQAFAAAVRGSALVQAALLWLELSSTHPAARGADAPPNIQWTLAQMLGLYCRAGYQQGELLRPAGPWTAPWQGCRQS